MVDIEHLENEVMSAITNATTRVLLEKIRIDALGKKGSVSVLLKTLGTMSPEERKIKSPLMNDLKQNILRALEKHKRILEIKELNMRIASEKIDITLPSRHDTFSDGRIHPVSQVMEQINSIFIEMDFSIAEGPDIETDFYNFTALNIPESHPARQMHDTFYFEPSDDGTNYVLRTHTSPVQIRTMQSGKPPFRFIAPGRTYRCDSDQTHTPMFHQVEGLVIDKNTHLGHLKWILEKFLSAFFEINNVKLRLRPSYFPFTEPSIEVDIQYHRIGDQLHIGEGTEWMEILGCGMVHPNVLKNVALDPEIYQGFAFGMGIDRLTMLKYGINDLRAFFNSDLRWLRHYGFSTLDIPHISQKVKKNEDIL